MNYRSILPAALSLSVGWGIRGNFGHEYGAMIPGALHDCCHCGEGIHSPSPFFYGADYYCPRCRDELFADCVGCGETIEWRGHEDPICEECAEKEEYADAE